MPNIFKALATIMAWLLWICCWVMGLSTLIMGIINERLFGSELTPMVFPASFAVALAFGVGSVVVMVLRKKME